MGAQERQSSSHYLPASHGSHGFLCITESPVKHGELCPSLDSRGAKVSRVTVGISETENSAPAAAEVGFELSGA